MTFLKYFFSIVGGALAASVLGGAFACVVALISPEFVATLFSAQTSAAGGSLVRYAAAVGMTATLHREGVFKLRENWIYKAVLS